ncbi:ribosomal RNA small subunit methyltransferase A [Candidatus Saccharibacteria bacterium]|nr:MAG: ribosomal RNA small subunit methyltransferase A [Candidatus Saccharibacteria bacterium]
MPIKSLGQHWLTDRGVLAAIANAADLTPDDTALEIGPGLGTLTSELLRRAGRVVAVEFDQELAAKLPAQFPGKNLDVVAGDILTYDLSQLPAGYKVVANVPYYITSKIVDKLMSADNRPRLSVLLVQQEVAERIAAGPGDMSLLAISAQIYAETSLGVNVPRQYFTPPPKVDSQVVILKTRPAPLVAVHDQKQFWRLVRAGFVGKRKKLRSSLSAGLALEKTDVEALLKRAGIDPNCRAQDLSIDDWLAVVRELS